MKPSTPITLGLSLLCGISLAQVGGRSFSYLPSDCVSRGVSHDSVVTLSSHTNITVDSYIYVSGNLGSNWRIGGWGLGSNEQTQTIRIYHTDSLLIRFVGFGDPVKMSGTATGAQSITAKGRITVTNDVMGQRLFGSAFIPMSEVNSLFDEKSARFGPRETGGLMRLDLTERLSIVPEVGPGEYQNAGVILIERN